MKNVCVDFFSESKVYQIYNLTDDEVYNAPYFKSINKALDFCRANNLIVINTGSTVDS